MHHCQSSWGSLGTMLYRIWTPRVCIIRYCTCVSGLRDSVRDGQSSLKAHGQHARRGPSQASKSSSAMEQAAATAHGSSARPTPASNDPEQPVNNLNKRIYSSPLYTVTPLLKGQEFPLPRWKRRPGRGKGGSGGGETCPTGSAFCSGFVEVGMSVFPQLVATLAYLFLLLPISLQ